MNSRWAALFVVALSACPVVMPPGDQQLGLYSTVANNPVGECSLSADGGADAGEVVLTFDSTITRSSTSGQVWLTIAGYTRDAGFDGQYFESTASATRVFDRCGGCQTQLEETISALLLSRPQLDALAGQCPLDPFDPASIPANVDGGVLPPQITSLGFDGARLCGTLTTVVRAYGMSDGGACAPECDGCAVRYQLRGDRR